MKIKKILWTSLKVILISMVLGGLITLKNLWLASDEEKVTSSDSKKWEYSKVTATAMPTNAELVNYEMIIHVCTKNDSNDTEIGDVEIGKCMGQFATTLELDVAKFVQWMQIKLGKCGYETNSGPEIMKKCLQIELTYE